MTKQTFKAGDMVYCPALTTKIIELKKRGDVRYPFRFSYNGVTYPCTADGKLRKADPTPAICHATEENHAMLEKLYGIEFEKPKSKPTPKEIIKHLLTKQKYVVCRVSDRSEDDARSDDQHDLVYRVIESDDDDFFDYKCSDCDWCYAIPIDLQGNEITSIDD